MALCEGEGPQDVEGVRALAEWAKAAFDYLAMGNFPYPSSYILNGDGVLPAWPVRVACSHLSDPSLEHASEIELVQALSLAIGVYYNASEGGTGCFSPGKAPNNASSVDSNNWDWQACSEMTIPLSTDGTRDMFWASPWDRQAEEERCRQQFGLPPPQRGWASTLYGSGYEPWTQASNIVFSNGLLDPWSGGGVLDQSKVGEGVRVILMEEAAHHLDLFFAHRLDPAEVVAARKEEMDLVEKWVQEAYSAVTRGQVHTKRAAGNEEDYAGGSGETTVESKGVELRAGLRGSKTPRLRGWPESLTMGKS
ncbi:unnamed protein product [Discosporangium mesarthrocarpum]